MAKDFYRALADMRRVTLQAKAVEDLYKDVCEIAVASGQALMAWVGLIKDGFVQPVAWAGPARQYTDGLNIQLAPPDANGQGHGPTAYAVTHGRPYVCNDYATDARTQPWRARAVQFGVGASVAYPVRRGGQVVGALNLYFRTPGSCDEALVELVDLMASDLSYALDHIDEQAARVKAQVAAERHEKRLADIIDAALEAIIVIDARFRILVFNRSASRMFGVAAEEVRAQPLDRFIPPAYREAHQHHLTVFADRGDSSRQMGEVRSLEALRADGTVFPIEASISRVGEGDQLLLTVMIRDVTKHREAEDAQLQRATAEAANRAKTEFLSRISHELRTPLNAIIGFAQLMQLDRADPASPGQIERISHILKAGQHLCTLIDETLDVARIESGRIQIDLADVDLGPLLDGVLGMSEPHALQTGVRLEAAYGPLRPLSVRTDPGRLKQVLLNLLSNAIKYNTKGGWVRVAVEFRGEWVVIVIRDSGLGMTPQQLASLFDPFNRLGREASAVQGTGLGLVLARQLVELIGGKLEIRSQAGAGTTATVALPR